MGAQVDADPHLSRIKAEVATDPNAWPKHTLNQGRLLYKGRLVLPQSSNLLPTILREYHTGLGGHSGFLHTYKRIIQDLYWPGM